MTKQLVLFQVICLIANIFNLVFSEAPGKGLYVNWIKPDVGIIGVPAILFSLGLLYSKSKNKK